MDLDGLLGVALNRYAHFRVKPHLNTAVLHRYDISLINFYHSKQRWKAQAFFLIVLILLDVHNLIRQNREAFCKSVGRIECRDGLFFYKFAFMTKSLGFEWLVHNDLLHRNAYQPTSRSNGTSHLARARAR